MKWKRLGMLAAGMAMLLVVASCGQGGGATSGTAASGAATTGGFAGTAAADTVVLDITAEPMELNSMLAYDAIGMNILAHCVSGIAKLDENDRPVADLAEKWEMNEDKTEYTIYLRQDAKWSNGEPVTAHDYYFAWVTLLKQETGAYLAALLYENIKNGEAFYNGEAEEADLGIEVIDDYTLKIEWERPMADGLFYLSRPAYFPINQKAYEEIGAEEYAEEADKLVTNGAYKLTKWVHDDHIMLEKSDEYYDAASIHVPKVKLVMIGDENTRLNAFTTGELDMCNVYSEQIAQVKEQDETLLQSYFDGATWYLGFNMGNQYLANENLRKALAYSVDIQSLLDNVIADGSTLADGLVPGTIAGAGNESYASARGSLFAYDLNKAKESMALALEELGVSAADITLTLDVANTTYSQNQALYIQDQWNQNLGLNVTVNAQTWNAIQEAKMNGDFAISVEVNSAAENSALSFLKTFTSSNPNNVIQYANPEFDSLVEQADNEGDPAKKQELMIEAETMLLADTAVGPMYFTCSTYAVSGKLQGLVRTPFQYFNVRNGATLRA